MVSGSSWFHDGYWLIMANLKKAPERVSQRGASAPKIWQFGAANGVRQRMIMFPSGNLTELWKSSFSSWVIQL